ncbi:3-deoxy-D-manno-octulosonic acid transferase [Rhodovulum sp. 12E13]|nr:3-deoxy-D-manno-octulosonic acid transferase [Rhodovulum sp. 12E13]
MQSGLVRASPGESGRGPVGWLRRALGVARPAEPGPRLPSERQPVLRAHTRRLLCIGPDHRAFADLSDRLADDLPDLEILLPAAPPGAMAATTGAEASRASQPPAERGRRAAGRWIAATAPDLALWHGEIGPGPLLEALLAAQVPVVAVDVPTPPGEVGRRRAWRNLLGGLSRILVRDEAAARALRQLGPAGLRLEVAGRFVPVPDPPPCDESDRDHFAQLLHGRPAWLAVLPTEAEIPAFVEAHRLALQGAHRLLLLLCPRDPAQGAALASWLRGEGWRVARHNAGEEPDDGTEVFVVDDPGEIGLWYRLAPICAIGGSFRPDAGGAADPADAARLGSAILCGPEGAPHAEWIERLDRAGGMARVQELGSLGVVLSDMLPPDRAASLAQVAWDVASDGARVQERVVAALRDVLRDTSSGAPPGPRARGEG